MLFRAVMAIINRDIKLYARRGGEMTSTLGFFLVALTLFPLGMGEHLSDLAGLAPGLIWVVVLLATLLSAPLLLAQDYRDGSLDQLRICGITLEWVVFAKCIANWIASLLPLILLTILVGYLYGLDAERTARLVTSLLVGTALLPMLAMIGSAVTLQARGGHGLLSLLVLPLYIPILIFATAIATSPIDESIFAQAETQLLLGLNFILLPLSCFCSAWLIRIQE